MSDTLSVQNICVTRVTSKEQADVRSPLSAAQKTLVCRTARVADADPVCQSVTDKEFDRVFALPISAFVVQLAARRTGRNYPQHLSFALHIHAAFFALLTATILVELLKVNWLSAAASLSRTALLVVYTVVAFHQAYGGAWGVAVGRTAVVLTG